MTKDQAQFTAYALGSVALALGLAFDFHRLAIAAVWPYMVAFFEWQAI